MEATCRTTKKKTRGEIAAGSSTYRTTPLHPTGAGHQSLGSFHFTFPTYRPLAPARRTRGEIAARAQVSFLVICLKNRSGASWFTWRFNQLPGISIDFQPKRTPMRPGNLCIFLGPEPNGSHLPPRKKTPRGHRRARGSRRSARKRGS